jgi:hypothetical protein
MVYREDPVIIKGVFFVNTAPGQTDIQRSIDFFVLDGKN